MTAARFPVAAARQDAASAQPLTDLRPFLTRCILTGDPLRRSAAVLLLAYLHADHRDRPLAQACARFLDLATPR